MICGSCPKKSALIFIVGVVYTLVYIVMVYTLTSTLRISQRLDYSYDYPYIYEGLGGVFSTWNEGLAGVYPVNCSRLIAGDQVEVEVVNTTLSRWRNTISDEQVLQRAKNCSWLKDYVGNNYMYNSKLEKSFPIAFTFVVHDSPQQVLRLLRLLYRPQNSYCIHCDAKSKHKVFFQVIADCLDNVIVPSRLENVLWGHYSVLGAQMNCMTDLLQLRTRQNHKWQYLLNLCGKELPLATNREMVEKLVKLNGSSNVLAYKSESHTVMSRIKYRSKIDKRRKVVFPDYGKPLGKPPFSISQFYKSQSYVALSYQFAHFLTSNDTAIEVHNFFKDCSNPEEHFYATMFMLAGVPGGYRKQAHYFWMESAFWMDGHHDIKCHGLVVHDICIVNVGDMSSIVDMENSHLFHNKYFMEYDHVVMWCMEWKLAERNRLEYQLEHNNARITTSL